MFLRARIAAITLVFTSFSGSAWAQERPYPQQMVGLDEVKPGQMKVGRDAVRAVMKLAVAKAIKNASETAKREGRTLDLSGLDPAHLDLDQATPEQRTKIASVASAEFEKSKYDPGNIVRAARAPDGKIYLTDGHHRSTALYLLKKEGFLPADASIVVHFPPEADFKNKSPTKFREYFVRKAYLTPEVRSALASRKITVAQALAKLPATLDELSRPERDLPLRSTLGLVFYECNLLLKGEKKARGEKGELMPEERGISGEEFEDYLEFKLGEAISCAVGSESGEGKYNSDEVLERARRAIFNDEKSLALLRKLEGPRKELAEKQIANSRYCYERIERERALRGLKAPPASACSLVQAVEQVRRVTRDVRSLPQASPCP